MVKETAISNYGILGNCVAIPNPSHLRAVIPSERSECAFTQGPIPERSVGNGKHAREQPGSPTRPVLAGGVEAATEESAPPKLPEAAGRETVLYSSAHIYPPVSGEIPNQLVTLFRKLI